MVAVTLLLAAGGALAGVSAAYAYTWSGCGWPSSNVTYANFTAGLYSTASGSAASNWSTQTDVNLASAPSSALTLASTYAANGKWGTTARTCNIFGQMTSANVYGNTYYLASTDANGKRMAFGHEISHALGLDHYNSTSSLMYPSADIYTVYGIYSVQSDDISGVNAHY